MSYQILVLDLDGTLTNSKKEISKPTLEALIDIQESGKKVILASGRPPVGIIPLATQLRLHDFGGYMLSFNGARITDCRTGEVLYNKLLPPDAVSSAFELTCKYRKQEVDILTYGADNIISGIRPNQYTKLESDINKIPVAIRTDFPSYIDFPVNKLLATGTPEVIKTLRRELAAYFRLYLNIYCSEPFFLEIMPQNIDKAHSLQRLLNSIGLTANEMICCGDGYNDITMIESAGLGVAMANAQPTVLERADYITKSNDDNGILHVIDEFMR